MPLHEPVKTSHNASPEERMVILKQIYHQVLERQPYISEQKQLADLETPFIKGKLGIRHFLKSLAIHPIYLKAFHENSSNLKFIENAFKHFLGRTPHTEEEIKVWGELLMRHGVGAMVSALIDSDEYRKAFGVFTVPYWRQNEHDTPNAYLENNLVGHELPGQRGWGIPTLYQHQLHLDCDGGTCHPQNPNEPLRPPQLHFNEANGNLDHSTTLQKPQSPEKTMNSNDAQRLSACIEEIAEILYQNTPHDPQTTLDTLKNTVRQQVLDSVERIH